MSLSGDKSITALRAAVLIASDRAASGARPDETLPLLTRSLSGLGIDVAASAVVPDDKNEIVAQLTEWSNSKIDLILVSGGTGVSPSDVTPEATLDVIDRRIPGIEEEMRRASARVTRYAMLSRAVAGISGSTLIVNLPGKPRAAVENFSVVAPVVSHAVELIRGGNPHE
jgi:molybdenum cofactor synthesis domain-containing protein